MSQEFVYAAIARPTLRPSHLIYRRRVAKTSASEPSRAALSREEKYRLEDSSDPEYEYTEDENLYQEQTKNDTVDNSDNRRHRIDDTV